MTLRPGPVGSSQALACLAWLAASAAVAACGGEDAPRAAAGSGLSGSVTMARPAELAAVGAAAAAGFQAAHPNVRVAPAPAGHDAGARVCAGRVQVVLAIAAPSRAGRRACARRGQRLAAIPIGTAAVAYVANRGLGMDCLTTVQLRRLWQRGSRITTYRAIDAGLPPVRVALSGSPPGSPAAAQFAAVAGGPRGRLRRDADRTGSDVSVLARVADARGGSGFVPSSVFAAGPRGAAPVSIRAGGACVAPTAAAIASGRYPALAAPVVAVVTAHAAQRPATGSLLAWMLDRNGEIAAAAGLVPLTGAARAAAERRLAALRAGAPQGEG